MDDALIYRKTKRGATELTATHGALSSPARRVLILLDGQRSLAELAELFGADSVEHIVAELEAQGFVRLVDADNALTTQWLPPVAAEPRLEPIASPPSRRGSMWIALGLLVAAAATAGGGYWFYLRPNHADQPSFAFAGANDASRSSVVTAPQEQRGFVAADSPAPRELPLSGLPAVTVKPTRVASAPAAPDAEVVPAAEVAVVPSARSDSKNRRSTERATPERATPPMPAAVLAAAKPAFEAEPLSDAGFPSIPSSSPPARTAAAPSTSGTASKPDQPAGESPSAASAPVEDSSPPAPTPASEPTPQTVGAAVGGTSTPATAKAPTQQIAALTPPAKPQSGPVQLHPRRHEPPEFPARAVRAKIFEGHVLARIWVTPEGGVDQVDIVKANPPRVFDDEVKRALVKWTFDPPGQPVDTTIELDFKP